MSNKIYKDNVENIAFLQSEYIHVFPCSGRGYQDQNVPNAPSQVFDPEAKYTTEHNLTAKSGHITDLVDSYIDAWSSAGPLICYIKGYYFNAALTLEELVNAFDPASFTSGLNLFAKIRLEKRNIYQSESTAGLSNEITEALANQAKLSPTNSGQAKTSTDLDNKINTEDASYYFTGLSFAIAKQPPIKTDVNFTEYTLKLATYNGTKWELNTKVCLDYLLKIHTDTGSISFNNCAVEGDFAFATGQNTSASGAFSHAEGNKTEAIGDYSHAEGNSSITRGANSHAEGQSTSTFTESSVFAHAEGKDTIAYSTGSHAEGFRTKTTDNESATKPAPKVATWAHAEGNSTKAYGAQSHTEGANTIASNTNAHAEGEKTIASGKTSHSEGISTTAEGDYSHAEGDSCKAYGKRSHAEGHKTQASKEGVTDKYAQHAEGTQTFAIGTASHAEGANTTAEGYASHTEGQGTSTSASAKNAHAEGKSTVADAENAHAEGKNTEVHGISAHAEGYNTVASGENSHAEGNSTITFGEGSHTEGSSTSTFGVYSHAEGIGSTTLIGPNVSILEWDTPHPTVLTITGTASFANDFKEDDIISVPYLTTQGSSSFLARITTIDGIKITCESSIKPTDYKDKISGQLSKIVGVAFGDYSQSTCENTSAVGKGSHAEGLFTKAAGDYSHTEGSTTYAWGEASHAEGLLTEATSDGAHAEGNMTIASGEYSHAEGTDMTEASGYAAHAEGFCTIAYGECTHTEGEQTTAYGNYSHAEGGDTTAFAEYSHAEGYNTKAISVGSHSEGTLTCAGGWKHKTEKNIVYEKPKDPENYRVVGEYSHAEGKDTKAYGSCSCTFGTGTTASGNNTVVCGAYNQITGSHWDDYVQDEVSDALFVVGNGTSDEERSDIFVVDKSGFMGPYKYTEMKTVDTQDLVYIDGIADFTEGLYICVINKFSSGEWSYSKQAYEYEDNLDVPVIIPVMVLANKNFFTSQIVSLNIGFPKGALYEFNFGIDLTGHNKYIGLQRCYRYANRQNWVTGDYAASSGRWSGTIYRVIKFSSDPSILR